MAYRKLHILGSYISMIRIRGRWPTKDPDSCISRFAAPGIGASLESFSLTLVDVGLEEGGLVGPITLVAQVAEVCDLVGIFPPTTPVNSVPCYSTKIRRTQHLLMHSSKKCKGQQRLLCIQACSVRVTREPVCDGTAV